MPLRKLQLRGRSSPPPQETTGDDQGPSEATGSSSEGNKSSANMSANMSGSSPASDTTFALDTSDAMTSPGSQHQQRLAPVLAAQSQKPPPPPPPPGHCQQMPAKGRGRITAPAAATSSDLPPPPSHQMPGNLVHRQASPSPDATAYTPDCPPPLPRDGADFQHSRPFRSLAPQHQSPSQAPFSHPAPHYPPPPPQQQQQQQHDSQSPPLPQQQPQQQSQQQSQQQQQQQQHPLPPSQSQTQQQALPQQQQQQHGSMNSGNGSSTAAAAAAAAQAMPASAPAPAAHQAELNYIYGMVEDLSRQLAENRRVTHEIVSGLGRVRDHAYTQGLSNEELLANAAKDINADRKNLEEQISVLSEALEIANHSRDLNATLLSEYASALGNMLKQFHEYKSQQVTDVSTWHRSYRTQLDEARQQNARLREQIWDMQAHASTAYEALRRFRRAYDDGQPDWDQRVQAIATRQELRFWKRMAMPHVAEDDPYWSADDDIVADVKSEAAQDLAVPEHEAAAPQQQDWDQAKRLASGPVEEAQPEGIDVEHVKYAPPSSEA